MKRLEGEVTDLLKEMGEAQSALGLEGHTVDPHQFLGIELNPWAAAVAELVLWIGYLQWHYRSHGRAAPSEPVLRDFHNIENRAALPGRPRPRAWTPKAAPWPPGGHHHRQPLGHGRARGGPEAPVQVLDYAK